MIFQWVFFFINRKKVEVFILVHFVVPKPCTDETLCKQIRKSCRWLEEATSAGGLSWNQVVQEEGGDEGTQEWEWNMDMRKLWPAVSVTREAFCSSPDASLILFFIWWRPELDLLDLIISEKSLTPIKGASDSSQHVILKQRFIKEKVKLLLTHLVKSIPFAWSVKTMATSKV